MASNLGYTLGTFALQNSPTMIGRQKRMGIGAMLGFDGSKDPNKSIIAQQAPSALSNPEAHIGDIIGGAIAKTPMSLSGAKTADPTVDTSSLGSFGDVNSSAGTDVTGAQSKTTKGNFWDSKGGGILSSLLGVLALGGLGAGIGAISGGGKGALQGASYGMGFGALQDLALRKSAMEGAANEEKLQYDLQKAQLSAIPTSKREYDLAQQIPGYDKFLREKDHYKSAYFNLALQKEGRLGQQDLENRVKDFQDRSQPARLVLDSFNKIEDMLGFDTADYDSKTGTILKTDPKTGKQIRQPLFLPGSDVPGFGRVYWNSAEGRQFQSSLQALKNLQIVDRSGKTQTLTEVENFLKEMGEGKFNTQHDLMIAYQNMQKSVLRKLKDIEAGYDNEVVRTYKSQGGTTLDDFLSESKIRNYGMTKRVFDTPRSPTKMPPTSTQTAPSMKGQKVSPQISSPVEDLDAEEEYLLRLRDQMTRGQNANQ